MAVGAARSGPRKRSIALVVFRGGRAGRSELLAVRRPPDDEELPDVWGLPAGSLRPYETWEEAVERAGREKLGVEVNVGPLLGEGHAVRDDYHLHMRVYEAEIRSGEPRVPQAVPGITQYAGWIWTPPGRLAPAAKRGSLCSRICLQALGESK